MHMTGFVVICNGFWENNRGTDGCSVKRRHDKKKYMGALDTKQKDKRKYLRKNIRISGIWFM